MLPLLSDYVARIKLTIAYTFPAKSEVPDITSTFSRLVVSWIPKLLRDGPDSGFKEHLVQTLSNLLANDAPNEVSLVGNLPLRVETI